MVYNVKRWQPTRILVICRLKTKEAGRTGLALAIGKIATPDGVLVSADINHFGVEEVLSMIAVHCPNCGVRIQVDEKYIGVKGRCNKCKQVFVVPKPTAPTAPVAKTPTTPAPKVANESAEVAKPRPVAVKTEPRPLAPSASAPEAPPAPPPSQPLPVAPPAPVAVPPPPLVASEPFSAPALPPVDPMAETDLAFAAGIPDWLGNAPQVASAPTPSVAATTAAPDLPFPFEQDNPFVAPPAPIQPAKSAPLPTPPVASAPVPVQEPLWPENAPSASVFEDDPIDPYASTIPNIDLSALGERPPEPPKTTPMHEPSPVDEMLPFLDPFSSGSALGQSVEAPAPKPNAASSWLDLGDPFAEAPPIPAPAEPMPVAPLPFESPEIAASAMLEENPFESPAPLAPKPAPAVRRWAPSPGPILAESLPISGTTTSSAPNDPFADGSWLDGPPAPVNSPFVVPASTPAPAMNAAAPTGSPYPWLVETPLQPGPASAPSPSLPWDPLDPFGIEKRVEKMPELATPPTVPLLVAPPKSSPAPKGKAPPKPPAPEKPKTVREPAAPPQAKQPEREVQPAAPAVPPAPPPQPVAAAPVVEPVKAVLPNEALEKAPPIATEAASKAPEPEPEPVPAAPVVPPIKKRTEEIPAPTASVHQPVTLRQYAVFVVRSSASLGHCIVKLTSSQGARGWGMVDVPGSADVNVATARALAAELRPLSGQPLAKLAHRLDRTGSSRAIDLALLDTVGRVNNVSAVELLGADANAGIEIACSLNAPDSTTAVVKQATDALASGFTNFWLTVANESEASAGSVLVRELLESLPQGTQVAVDAPFIIGLDRAKAMARKLGAAGAQALALQLNKPLAANFAQISQLNSLSVVVGSAIRSASDLVDFARGHAVDQFDLPISRMGIEEGRRMAWLASELGLQFLGPCEGKTPFGQLVDRTLLAALGANLPCKVAPADSLGAIFSAPLGIVGGRWQAPNLPGWGCDVNETVLRSESLEVLDNEA